MEPLLSYRLWLGPMAGYTDSAMRQVCHESGAEASVSEMISAKAVVYRDKKTFSLAFIRPEEGPVSLQLFGSEPSVMAEAAARLATSPPGCPPIAIDINMGCPVPKVAGNGEGSALMKDPTRCYEIAAAMRRALPPSMPLTAKIRLGWDPTRKNAAEVAAALGEAGVSLLFVHGRTRAELYNGEADWETIAALCAVSPLPIIGNGDIRTPEDACRKMRESGVSGIMIARAAIGNPLLFAGVAAALRGEAFLPPTAKERAAAALRQLSLAVREKGETFAVRESRKQIACCFSGLPGSAAVRAAIHTAESYERICEILTSYADSLPASAEKTGAPKTEQGAATPAGENDAP